eukprot:4073430-Pleurochrysis_carterae.AAC.1
MKEPAREDGKRSGGHTFACSSIASPPSPLRPQPTSSSNNHPSPSPLCLSIASSLHVHPHPPPHFAPSHHSARLNLPCAPPPSPPPTRYRRRVPVASRREASAS